MGIPSSTLALVGVWIVQMFASFGDGATPDSPCFQHTCATGPTTSLNCTNSRILISDVTRSANKNRDVMALENLKRTCMGNWSCDSTRVCGRPGSEDLIIHYLCVDANQIIQHNRACSRTHKVQITSGYIQSPGYPSRLIKHKPCRWRLSLGPGDLVVITLHDVHTNGSGVCDGGLMVSGDACDGEGHAYAPRLLCGGDVQSSFVRCGEVDIGLSPSAVVYPLRFWLSFQIQSRKIEPSLGVPRCPKDSYHNPNLRPDTGLVSAGQGSKGTTMAPSSVVENSNTELLVILLSIISGISIVLFIILIVVCIRCRLLQSPHPDQIYSVPSPGLQAHMDYISTLESDQTKSRPQLADGYFEVADALPIALRADNLASPAYAEVEQFAPLNKEAWPNYSEPDVIGAPPQRGRPSSPEGGPQLVSVSAPDVTHRENPPTDSQGKVSRDETGTPILHKPPDPVTTDKKKAKKGVLDRIRGDRSPKTNSNPNPNLLKHPRTQMLTDKKAPPLDKNANDSDSSVYEDCTSSGYEPIDFPPKHSTKPSKAIQVPSHQRSKSSNIFRYPPDHSSSDVNKENLEKTPSLDKSMPGRFKTLPHIPPSDKGQSTEGGKTVSRDVSGVPPAETGRLQGVQRHRGPASTKRDVPQARGIVKNGIKLFERQDAVV